MTDNGGVIETIISLPPKLFYGTGIPAAILVLTRHKPDSLRDKVFFINADAEYGEGKNQNSLRPEDIEKIEQVYSHKRSIPGYARLVDIAEIRANDWNLNIRRYVDNTPPPEPEDVRAHLVGGVPKTEIAAKAALLAKFGLDPALVFQERDAAYYDFRPGIDGKATLKARIEADAHVQQTLASMRRGLSDWWFEAQTDFARLASSAPVAQAPDGELYTVKDSAVAFLTLAGPGLPDVRRALIESLQARLVPLGVLDEFQVAGVFVNWWDGIKYDLKTITTNGWSPALIPDAYLVAACFQTEADEIENIKVQVGEREAALEEAVTAAQEVLEYEADEGETVTAALMRQALSAALKDWQGRRDVQAKVEQQRHAEALGAIKETEERLRDLRRLLKEKQGDLELRLLLKQFGPDDESAEARRLLAQAAGELAQLEALARPDREQQKKIAALKRDSKTLQARIDALARLTDQVGGVIGEDEAKGLILQKHHDLVAEQLERYLGAEKRRLLTVFENLYNKYAVPSDHMERQRLETLGRLTAFLHSLSYL